MPYKVGYKLKFNLALRICTSASKYWITGSEVCRLSGKIPIVLLTSVIFKSGIAT